LPAGTKIAVQAEPLGTGDAVRAAIPQVPDDVDVLVTWGSQPLISAATLAESITVYQALRSAAMLFPTAVTRTPYAPIQRDLRGYVIASLETATEGAPTKRLGETNVGAFLLSARTLKETLTKLQGELWNEEIGRYATKSGELGFPNEMARALVRAGRTVIALPLARVEESLGLRNRSGCEEVKRILAQRRAAAPKPAVPRRKSRRTGQ
jgi:bifunctional N-acetylglucosamine-1-phosphate-uridyltransferase/glucosamine-1-phosphate-acetyltransferase GlmU-like protein